MNNKLLIRIISSISILFTIALSCFFVIEASKEVHYLCQNFTDGVSKQSVIKQLDTGTFLNYQESESSSGNEIIVSSLFTLNLEGCRVLFNINNEVKERIDY